MRILLVHNYLRPPSGENTVFENERDLLKSKGHDLITYIRNNDEINDWNAIDNVSLPIRLIWSKESCLKIEKLLKEFKPDVAHFHNIFPLISPAAYHACQRHNTAVVQTLHHYRLVCPGALLFRKGEICEKCKGLNFSPAIRYGCYRNSRLQTAGLALMIYLHYLIRTWQNKVDIYIALSKFAMKKFQELGFDSDRISIKSNFLPFPIEPSFCNKDYIIFIGRLGEEKGLICLLEAMRNCPEIKIKIFGDGPLRNLVLSKLQDYNLSNIEYMGLADHALCMKYLSKSKFMVFPSICYEGMPMVVLEAMAAGKPVIASRIGVTAEMIKDGACGLVFAPGSVLELTENLKWLNKHPEDCIEMGKRGRKALERNYTSEKNHELLISVYQRAIEHHRASNGK